MTRTPSSWLVFAKALLATAGALPLAGCRQDMHDQPRFEPFEQSSSFADGRSARAQVTGTIARGQLQLDTLLHTGKTGDDAGTVFPFAITRSVLERGRERFEICCAPCHGLSGTADGIVVQRGFRVPPSLHLPRLREAPPGHFVDVARQGFGTMYDQKERVGARDRWAIAAYIRVLQLSRNAKLEDVPAGERQQLMEEAK